MEEMVPRNATLKVIECQIAAKNIFFLTLCWLPAGVHTDRNIAGGAEI